MKSRYIPLTQQPFCCLPTCIQMILLRRKLKLLSQEEIGRELGLIVPKEYKKILPLARTGKKPSSGWGTQASEKKFSINKFLKKFKYPLREKYFPLSKIKDVEKWLAKELKEGSDIMVCFNYKRLYGEGNDGGHISLIEKINYYNKTFTLIDPEGNVPKFRDVKIKKLVNSIKYHGKKNYGGFIVLK